jgi:hypothetical protein
MKVILNPYRDIPLLHFLWRWKVSTTLALCYKFFPKSPLHTGYKRILQLRDAELITPRSDRYGSKRVWTLTQKGYKLIRPDLPALKEEGFASESVSHDLLASAIQIGDFLLRQPPHIRLMSEQQLRRYEISAYPSWVPKSLDRRPDGYWRIESGIDSKIIALEVEINAKSKDEYYQILSSYSFESQIGDVLWFVQVPWLGKLILSVAGEFFSRNKNVHSFILIDDFLKTGWQSKIFLGKCSKQSVSDVLVKRDGNMAGTSMEHGAYQQILNLQKSPRITAGSRLFTIGDFT